MDTQKIFTMTIDELSAEISETKKRLSALEKLFQIRQELGEKTKKQIEAKERAEKKANDKPKKDTKSESKSAAKTEPKTEEPEPKTEESTGYEFGQVDTQKRGY